MSLNFPHKDYSQLFPILENGLTPVIKGTVYSLGSLLEVTLIFLFNIN